MRPLVDVGTAAVDEDSKRRKEMTTALRAAAVMFAVAAMAHRSDSLRMQSCGGLHPDRLSARCAHRIPGGALMRTKGGRKLVKGEAARSQADEIVKHDDGSDIRVKRMKEPREFSIKVADADDAKGAAWVVTEVFVNEWSGPLRRQVTWIQRRRMWMNVFLSMLTRFIIASFFLGLEIGETSRLGRREQADEDGPGPASPVVSPSAAHKMLVAIATDSEGGHVIAGVIEVNCRKYPLPAGVSVAAPDGKDESAKETAVDNQGGEDREGCGRQITTAARRWEHPQRPYISNLAVRKEFRGCGVANALMERAEAEVQKWGFDDVVLDVNCDNIAALQLYRKRGYVAEFVDPMTRQVRRAFMRRRLSPSARAHPPDALTLEEEEDTEEESEEREACSSATITEDSGAGAGAGPLAAARRLGAGFQGDYFAQVCVRKEPYIRAL
jgi:GNAT superfamily N-acetyltransferase